jgi:hypothetical protein
MHTFTRMYTFLFKPKECEEQYSMRADGQSDGQEDFSLSKQTFIRHSKLPTTRINKFMNFRRHFPSYCLKQLCWNFKKKYSVILIF